MSKIVYKEDNLNTAEIRKPTKSQTFIRVIAMICKVISMIVFVVSIIGFITFLIGSCWVVTNRDTIIYSNRTVDYWIRHYGSTVYTVSLNSLLLAFVSAGTIALSWLCWRYFGHMFRNKTPFTFKTFRDGIRIAIVSGGILIVGAIITGIVFGIYKANYGSQVSWVGFKFWPFIAFGLFILIISFIFRHGAELRERLAEKKAK